MDLTLYELATEYRSAANTLGDLSLPEEVIVDTLEGLSGDLETKAQNVAFFARNLESTAAAIKQAEADMAARRKAMENRADGLKRYIFESMTVAGIEKIECPHFRLAIKNNPAAVDVFEPGLVPASFMRTPEPPPPAPDKTAIKEALKAGQDVPGARLTSGQRLEIK